MKMYTTVATTELLNSEIKGIKYHFSADFSQKNLSTCCPISDELGYKESPLQL